MTGYHLAQINIAKAKEELTSSTMEGFVARLDEINALADTSDGFVWRLQTEDGDATALRVFDDPMLIVNMSVWRDAEALKNFVYKTTHVELLKDRSAWFDKIQEAHQALWWITDGQVPTLEQGKEKLNRIQREGSSDQAFTFANIYPHPE
jgi:hypothetical protein